MTSSDDNRDPRQSHSAWSVLGVAMALIAPVPALVWLTMNYESLDVVIAGIILLSFLIIFVGSLTLIARKSGADSFGEAITQVLISFFS